MKKLATFAMIGVLAVFSMAMTSCKKGDGGKKGSVMTVKFNNRTYDIPSTLSAEEGYYCDRGDNYQLYFNWQTNDNDYIDINIDLEKSLMGATPYTLTTGVAYWYFDASVEMASGEVYVYSTNSRMGNSDANSNITIGKIRMEHLGGGKFRLVANAMNNGNDTFSIDFEGTLAGEAIPSR